MPRCSRCAEKYGPDIPDWCWDCGSKLWQADNASAHLAVGSTELVAELESALNHVANALDRWPTEERGEGYESALLAGAKLLNAINARRSSATDQALARRTAHRNSQSEPKEQK